jgi:hypothetical protein
MDLRPVPSNGKNNVFWGTRTLCSVCGRCLCFGCHPHGPCVDDRTKPARVEAEPVARGQGN